MQADETTSAAATDVPSRLHSRREALWRAALLGAASVGVLSGCVGGGGGDEEEEEDDD